MPRLLFILLFLLSTHHCKAQEKESIQPFLVFDSYYSFIGNKSADVWGFKAGVEWNKQWRFGIGYNKLSSDIIEYKKLPAEEISYAKNDTVKAQLFLTYYPVMAEYIFYRKDPWQLSTPIHLGYGNSYFQYFDKTDSGRKIFKHGILASQIGINAQYKVLKWFGVAAGIGYRIMLANNPDIDTRMSSPVFAVGIKVFPGEIIRSIRED